MNKEKCSRCQYYGKRNDCFLMIDRNISGVDVCILDVVKEKNWDKRTLEMFVLQNNPKLFLSYLSFLRKDKLPKVGDKVITLHGGFGNYDSRVLYVSNIADKYIELADFIIENEEDEWDECNYYLSYIDEWYKDLFVFDDNN